jgi:hypothetical protein
MKIVALAHRSRNWKLSLIDNVGEISEYAENDCNRLRGGAPTHVKYNVKHLFYFFLAS